MDFNSTGAMRSPFSPRVRQSNTSRRPMGISSAQKNQSKFTHDPEQAGDVIYKSSLITVETYGTPLPVMVTEALISSSDVSVRVSSCGWCWLVAGRRALCWPREPGGAARELTLPQTDLAHKADLVVLFYEEGAQMPACVGVSPEGVVRYWASVAAETYADVTCELGGQECARLVRAGPRLALATTSGSLLELTVGEAGPRCRTLRPPAGWLGGLQRRVSHLFFGAMPAAGDAGRLAGAAGCATGAVALAARGPALQLWAGGELLAHELRRPLLARLQLPDAAAELRPLDLRAAGPARLALLLALPAHAALEHVRYAIAYIDIEDPAEPRITSVVHVRGWGGGAAGAEAPRLLPLPPHALLYGRDYVCAVMASGDAEKVEYVSLCGEGDALLGAGAGAGRALLCTRAHGLLALALHADSQPPRPAGGSPPGSPCVSDMYDGNLSLYEIDPHEVSKTSLDPCGKLKTAFLYHVRRDEAACRALLQAAFPARGAEADAPLDRTVLAVATELLDDMPAGDPRWRPAAGAPTRVALGSSAALHVQAQLQDKKRAFALLLDFLRARGLWVRLGTVYIEGAGVCRTESALRALAERLAAAAALRQLQRGPRAQLVDAAIYQVVCGPGAEGVQEESGVESALSAGALSPSDVCYRRVSRIERVLVALARAAAAQPEPACTLHALQALSSVWAAMAGARAGWRCEPAPGRQAALLAGRAALRAALRLGAEPALRAQLAEAAAELATLLLDDAAALPPETVADFRDQIIRPFLERGLTERAAALAERHRDFRLLAEVCVAAADMPRLAHYVHEYADEGMGEVAYAYLWQRGGRWRAALAAAGGAARAWLGAAPERAPLAALRALAAAPPEPALAARALLRWARARPASLARYTTAVSLARLCAQAAPAEAELAREAAAALLLAEHHAALPPALREACGLAAGDCPLMAPERLVQLYVECDSPSLTEYDYKKALDLTDCIEDPDLREEYRIRVWCACIVHSEWTARDERGRGGDNVFSRLLALLEGAAWARPPLEQLLRRPELAALAAQPRLHHLLRLQLLAPPGDDDAAASY